MPHYPEHLEYLLDWVETLYGRSGANMAGANPLSPVVLAEWAKLMDIDLHPFEVEAVLLLDSIMIYAGSDAEAKEQPTTVEEANMRHKAWPDKK